MVTSKEFQRLALGEFRPSGYETRTTVGGEIHVKLPPFSRYNYERYSVVIPKADRDSKVVLSYTTVSGFRAACLECDLSKNIATEISIEYLYLDHELNDSTKKEFMEIKGMGLEKAVRAFHQALIMARESPRQVVIEQDKNIALL